MALNGWPSWKCTQHACKCGTNVFIGPRCKLHCVQLQPWRHALKTQGTAHMKTLPVMIGFSGIVLAFRQPTRALSSPTPRDATPTSDAKRHNRSWCRPWVAAISLLKAHAAGHETAPNWCRLTSQGVNDIEWLWLLGHLAMEKHTCWHSTEAKENWNDQMIKASVLRHQRPLWPQGFFHSANSEWYDVQTLSCQPCYPNWHCQLLLSQARLPGRLPVCQSTLNLIWGIWGISNDSNVQSAGQGWSD